MADVAHWFHVLTKINVGQVNNTEWANTEVLKITKILILTFMQAHYRVYEFFSPQIEKIW